MSKNSIPKIRFYDFSDNWESKQIGELGSVAMNKRIFKGETSETGEVPFYKIGTFGGEPDSFITRDKFEEYKSKYPYPEIGDILLSASGSIGRTVEYQGEEAYFQDSNIVWLKHDERLDNSFLKQFYSIVKWEGIEGTTIKRLYNKNILETLIALPSQEEQSAIGSLFRTLDALLASYKNNLANYQSLKATMLSKMFPKAEQTVSEIRLDGFEGEWEVVNLGTLIENYDEVISGTSGFPIATSSRKGLYLQNDYFEGGRTGIDLTLDFHRVPIGYVTYRHMSDDSIFKFNKNNFETDVLVSKEYPVFINNDNSDIDFLLYHLNNSRLFLRFSTMQKLGGTRVRLYYKNLIAYKLAVPTVKEQQAIGSYFSNLDSLINSNQEKISQLETLKKKLLQDMFI